MQQVYVICQSQVSAPNQHLGRHWLDQLGEPSSLLRNRKSQDRRLLGTNRLKDVEAGGCCWLVDSSEVSKPYP